MTENHPITPSPELVEQWECEYHHSTSGPDLVSFISEKAARWGADHELEACCEWLDKSGSGLAGTYAAYLRAARRPKPPSLKEQALAVLDHTPKGWGLAEVDLDTIRRALEELPD